MRLPFRLALIAIGAGLALAAISSRVGPAAGLVARVAGAGGLAGAIGRAAASPVEVQVPTHVATRHGEAPLQVYEPGAGRARRTTILIPGIHSMGIDEPRLKTLATELAATGVRVVAVAPPDLMTYGITPRVTDVIEDTVTWASAQPSWTDDGRVGLMGISFAGGLSIVAAGRRDVRDRVAYVVSFGGHGDLPRVMRYLATGEAPAVPGIRTVPPHDYGLAVLLYGLADEDLVPPAQVADLRTGIRTFLLASQLTLVDTERARRLFAEARTLAAAMPPPSSVLMAWTNGREVARLGPVLAPLLDRLGADAPDLSPARTADLPSAPVFLLHGSEDPVIPTAETPILRDYLQNRGVSVRTLVTPLITHAELDGSAGPVEAWRLVSFWAELLRR